jgi:hypothetical protein
LSAPAGNAAHAVSRKVMVKNLNAQFVGGRLAPAGGGQIAAAG